MSASSVQRSLITKARQYYIWKEKCPGCGRGVWLNHLYVIRRHNPVGGRWPATGFCRAAAMKWSDAMAKFKGVGRWMDAT